MNVLDKIINYRIVASIPREGKYNIYLGWVAMPLGASIHPVDQFFKENAAIARPKGHGVFIYAESISGSAGIAKLSQKKGR